MTNNTADTALDLLAAELAQDTTAKTRVEPFPHRGQTWVDYTNAAGYVWLRVVIYHDDARVVVHEFDGSRASLIAGTSEFNGSQIGRASCRERVSECV